MIGFIPIIDGDGERVAVLKWTGTMWRGHGIWLEHTSEVILNKLKGAVLASGGLKTQRFSDMVGDASYVRGWQGFAGWFQALAIALPPYGLDIDRENIIWPIVQVEASSEAQAEA